MRSIRSRLLLLQLSAVLLVCGLAVAAVYYRARDVFYEMQDYHLQQVALLLMQQGELADRGGNLLPDNEDLDFIGQVWSENGKLIYSSHRDYPLPEAERAGFSTVEWDEEMFRIYAMSRHGHTVQVAQSLEVREAALRGISLRLLIPVALLVPLLGAATGVTVGRGLRPLASLRDEVVRRNPGSMKPIALSHAPDEVKPLVESLNDLLARLAEALTSQRRFTADAAHELRTPLTAVKLQFQLLERSHTDQERQAALSNLKSGIERAIHLVEQLLTLARLEPAAAQYQPAPVSLTDLARRAVEDFDAIANDRAIALRLARTEAVELVGDADQLRTLLNNLVDNALRYTPGGGAVDISVMQSAGAGLLEVADSGPGIPAAERERVFDRFYRVSGTGASGSGLGLSIALRVAEAHGASIELGESVQGGLRVRVRFPSPRRP
jgi:two-component system, OmpR family, sensor kinase